jgi:hypothetical protein
MRYVLSVSARLFHPHPFVLRSEDVNQMEIESHLNELTEIRNNLRKQETGGEARDQAMSEGK